MVASNQDGSDKLPLLVIGKYARPRCLRNTNMDLLPVKYKSQRNAWMDNMLYEPWVREIDPRMKGAKRNNLLTVDNCTAHVTVNGLTNTKVIFLPPNSSPPIKVLSKTLKSATVKPWCDAGCSVSLKGKQLKALTSKMHCS